MRRAKVVLKYHGRKLKGDLDKVFRKRLAQVGEVVASEVRRELRAHSTRVEGPSAPGEVPHADEGNLSKSVSYSVDPIKPVVEIGTTSKVGFWLEEGTKRMAARPHLRPITRRLSSRVNKILTAPIEGKEIGGKLRVQRP